MGKQNVLSLNEKQQIVQLLSAQTTCQIAKLLGRDHRTIKKFVVDYNAFRKLSKRIIQPLKRALVKFSLSSSIKVFSEANVSLVSKPIRCCILRKIESVYKAKKQPPMTKRHKTKRLSWARNNMKTNFNNVLFKDKCRATLNRPDGFSRDWILEHADVPIRIKRQ